MNSWIGGSLSSLKGQLTHLITEGTEEIPDPKGDLITAKQHISNLEGQIRCLSADVKELTEKNNDLKIKLQSEEMLSQNVSDSYKEKLKEKEGYIENLRAQISSGILSLSNADNYNIIDSSIRRDEDWSSEFCDFVNQSSKEKTLSRSGQNEADSLRQRISELNQDVLRWRTIAESTQSTHHSDSNGNSEGSLTKLLEIQRQDLELQHSNYILELQREHNKQLSFLKRASHQRTRSSETDDYEPFESRTSDLGNIIGLSPLSGLVPAPKETNGSAEECREKTMSDAACQYSFEAPHLPDQMTGEYSTMFRLAPGTIAQHIGTDSMSQVSDISEVSVKSRLLDEQVRHLSDRIQEYGQQLTTIDDLAVVQADQDHIDPDQLNNKLQHLKMKLSQRKNTIIEQNTLLITAQIPGNEGTCVDSWDNSSENSLVQEGNVDTKNEIDLASRINDIYHILFLNYPGNDLSILDNLASIRDFIVNMRSRMDHVDLVTEGLRGLYSEIVGTNPGLDQDTTCLQDIKDRFNDLSRQIDTLLERCSTLDIMASACKQEKFSLEEEILELAKKNGEYEEKMEDMSSTITRYEHLEKVCDNYERELSELRGGSKKTDLCMDSDDILEHVKTFNEEKDECIEKLESRIISLQNFCEEKDDFIKAMKEREVEVIYEYDCSIEVLNNELDNVRATVEKSYENEIEYKKQIYRMNLSIKEKDEMINSLNEELTMLSHQNTEEDIGLMLKKEVLEEAAQTEKVGMAVEYEDDYVRLQDELGVLITENKRLGEVIEAQADSLGQYEARVNSMDAEIERLSRGMEARGPLESLSGEDMARETLHHLSQMIRDKDWEIEALKSKNNSLCTILKESSCGADSDNDVCGPIDKLLNEKEALSKEVLWYQENREQLVNALNLKHKESLNYHGEIQRLVAFINVEQVKWGELTTENERMKAEIHNLLAEKESKYLVDTAVEFRDALPSYDECMEAGNSGDQCKSLKERVATLELDNRHSVGEIRRLEKQLERVSYELEESRLQFSELTLSHDRCQVQMSHYQEELAKLCKVDVTCTQLVEAAKDIWNNEIGNMDGVDGVMREYVKADIVEEADQSRIYQLQCEDLLHQIDQLKAKELKLLKEKQIFQEHLIRIEESYTLDATTAEDREQCLRTQLRQTEDQLMVAQDRVADLEATARSVKEQFLVETCDVRRERDEAVRRSIETEARLLDTVSSLNNLQEVLDKFQQEQALELTFQKERLQQELRCVSNDRDKWQRHCVELQMSVDAQNETVEAAQRLTDQMERKDDQLAQMQATMSRKDEVIDNLKMEIRKLNSVTESKVDKILMRNLVIGYFHTPLNKRQDALRVIGSLLQFSDQDYNQIGIDTANKSRWFSWLRSASIDSKDQEPQMTHEHSFSELFIRFLERESTPLPQLRLPTNQVAAEARQHSSLSQSDDLPYIHTSSPSQALTATSTAAILDHHKFFSSSPLVTKRSAGSSDGVETVGGQEANTLVLVPGLCDGKVGGGGRQSGQQQRRRDQRNPLLSVLEAE